MVRSSVSQRSQIGLETVTGTSVPATKVLQSLTIELSPDVESQAFRPRGSKYATVVAANKEWSSGDLDGTPTYDELVYPLASIFGKPANPTAIMDGATPTGAYLWVFNTNSSAADVPATYTLEQGDAALAEKASSLVVTDFGLDFSRDETGVSGSVIASALVRGIALTVGAIPVAIGLVPILPGQVCVYVSDDPDTLGDPATHVPNIISVNPKVGGKYGPAWFLNCLVNGFSSVVEQAEPDFTVDLVLEADAANLGWAQRFRTGETRFIRVEATGPEIDPGEAISAYRLTWDLAVKTLEPGEYSDEDGVYATAPSLQVVHDAAWGKASVVELVNTVASL